MYTKHRSLSNWTLLQNSCEPEKCVGVKFLKNCTTLLKQYGQAFPRNNFAYFLNILQALLSTMNSKSITNKYTLVKLVIHLCKY